MDHQRRPLRVQAGVADRPANNAERRRGRGPDAPRSTVASESLRARLDGVPCLVTLADDATMTGRMAVPPLTGERSPMPERGRRATLDLLAPTAAGERPSDQASLASIEIMIVEARWRSGRFAARVLGLTEDQAQALSAWALS